MKKDAPIHQWMMLIGELDQDIHILIRCSLIKAFRMRLLIWWCFNQKMLWQPRGAPSSKKLMHGDNKLPTTMMKVQNMCSLKIWFFISKRIYQVLITVKICLICAAHFTKVAMFHSCVRYTKMKSLRWSSKRKNKKLCLQTFIMKYWATKKFLINFWITLSSLKKLDKTQIWSKITDFQLLGTQTFWKCSMSSKAKVIKVSQHLRKDRLITACKN